MPTTTGSKIVDEMVSVNIQGNVIPHNWYSHIKMPNGKVDLNAIVILSEIVYWYRPTEVKDEKTGVFIGYKKRFKSDLLQRSYDSFSEQFGLTKRQVIEAVKRLEDKGIIKRVFRHINATNGTFLANVLFIELNVNILKHITFKSGTSHIITGDIPHYNVTPPTLKRGTNTESTTETTTKTTNNKDIGSSEEPPSSSKKEKKKSILSEEQQAMFEEFINHLNKEAKKRFTYKNKDYQKLFKARLTDGYELKDFIYVIDVKTEEWLNDNKMNTHLNPGTLLKEKYFENYLNQPMKKKKNVNDPNDFGAEALEQNFNNDNNWGF